jgi:cytochrome c553
MMKDIQLRKSISFIETALLCTLVAVLASCGSKELEKKIDAPDLTKFSGLYSSYLKSCSECHEPGNERAYKNYVPNLDMSTEEATYTSLMKVADRKSKAGLGCSDLKFVTAGAAAQSLLFAVLDVATADALSAGSDASCKPTYHTLADGGEANNPTAEQKEAIKNWINNGAPRN